MLRLSTLLIAAVVAIALGAPIAQSQTEQAPPAGQDQAAPKGKKGLSADEKAKRKEERVEKKKAREDKKAAKAAKKAKREECRAKGKQDNLKGKKLREYVQTCTAG